MMNDIDLNLIGRELANKLFQNLIGIPTENRIVIAVSGSEQKTASGLFIPDQAKNDIPKKGVVIKKGPNNDCPDHEALNIGDVVSYGMYGGKEIYPTFLSELPEIKDLSLKYFVLSSTEVIYVEPNLK